MEDPYFYIFRESVLPYEHIQMYIKYVNDVPMMIKYFYDCIKTSTI